VILLLSKTPDPTTLEFSHRPSPHQPSSRPRSARRLRPPSGPEGGGESTSQGRSYGIFQKAIQRRNVVAAVAAAKELPQLSLIDALELTMLIARKDSNRYPRVAARWLQRLLEEQPDATIEEAALAAACLVALPGAGYGEAAQALKAMAETAPRRRRAQGIA
jgi:hypothetical protein